MSFNILNQVVEKIKKSTFGMYTTDITNLAQLCYVRYTYNGEFEDEFLFCDDLKSRTTAKDIFEKVSNFFEEHDLDWQNLCGVCTDGAPAMLGHKSGFQTLVKGKSPSIIGSHCMIHRQALIMKNIPELLKNVLNDVIKTINTIKATALNSRLFTLLCEENDSDFKTLLLHTQVRWLSKGKAQKRVYILRKEISELLTNSTAKDPTLRENFSNNQWIAALAFLVDIFEAFNVVNKLLQGNDTNVIHCKDKMTAFSMKLDLWVTKTNACNFAPFPTMNSVLDEKEIAPEENLLDAMKWHLLMLKKLSHYFPELERESEWSATEKHG